MTTVALKRLAAKALIVSLVAMALTHAAAFAMHHFEWYGELFLSVLFVAAYGTVFLAALSFVVLSYTLVASALRRSR